MSALPPKADILFVGEKSPLSANSGRQLVRFSWHEFERLGWLQLARSIASEDLAARHCEFLHRRALREVQVRQWNPEGIGASCGVEEQYLVLLVPNRAPQCR